MNFDIYRGKRVFVTGHTGFKGSWLCEWLLALGAEVHGYALKPPTKPALFNQLKLAKRIKSHTLGDVRDLKALKAAVKKARPDFVFHLAAQPLVRASYADPVGTFDTNVMGTVNLMEAVRSYSNNQTIGKSDNISVVCITTDKCYENKETTRPYREDDPMGGYDPYSCSKGCDELAIASYRRSFFSAPGCPVRLASARAGNVIGGGDWALDRIVPDCMRALDAGQTIPVRNKVSTRPWQHVLEPLGGYLTLGAALAAGMRDAASGFNFGPDPKANRTVKELVTEILKHRKGKWTDKSDPKAVHEAGLLNLDIRKAKRVLGWKPRWNFEETVARTVEWYAAVRAGADPRAVTRKQIDEYAEKL